MNMFRRLLGLILVGTFLIGAVSCDPDDSDPGTDSDTDTDSDSDSDTDTDSDSDSDGEGNTVMYSLNLTPKQDEVLEGYEFNIGDVAVYRLGSAAVDYSASAGASVNLDGVSFELESESLLEEVLDYESGLYVPEPVDDALIQIFEVPLDEWYPEFNHFDLDAIYYINPYFALLSEGGVALSVEAPEGWSEGDVGTTYMLGDYKNGLNEIGGYDHLYQKQLGDEFRCVLDEGPDEENEKIEVGHLADCGPATYEDGRVITSSIPRLGWVGIKKGQAPEQDELTVTCIASISLTLTDPDGMPITNQENAVQLCVPGCQTFGTDENGQITVPFNLDTDGDGEGDVDCVDFDFSEEMKYIHLSVLEF